jgi:hypothetical protein
LLWDFFYKKTENYFSLIFPFYFNAANISLLSPKVAAGAFVEELDDVFSEADFIFLLLHGR